MNLGTKIRILRRLKGITQELLAKQAGLTKSSISQIEKNKISPSVPTIMKICSVLGTTASRLFDGLEVKEKIIVRGKEREKIPFNIPKVNIYRLTSDSLGKDMEPLYLTADPGAESDKKPYSYKGQKFGLVLRGKVKLILGKKEYILNEGDSAYFDASVPHKWKNISKNKAILLWVSSPPSI